MVAKQEWQLLETRTISGRGLFRVPENDKYRHLYLYVNVIRTPRVNFTSSKWNPDRSEYCKITWMRDGFVLREDVINYEYQRLQWAIDPGVSGYLAPSMACYYESIIRYLDYLAPFIPAPPLIDGDTVYTDPLKDAPDEIKIVCRESTAIVAKLYYLEYDYTCPVGEPQPKEPPDPEKEPQQPNPAPIGDISPPYQEPNDDGDTVPYQGDENPPPPDPVLEPPFGATGEVYTISFDWDLTNSSGTVLQNKSSVFINQQAPILDYGISSDLSAYGASVGAYVISTDAVGNPRFQGDTVGGIGTFFAANIRNIVTSLQ